MRKLLTALAALACMLAAAVGLGAAVRADSTPLPIVVTSVDPVKHMVVAENGARFYAAGGVQVDGLQPGTRLLLYLRTIGGRKTIVSYEFVHD